MKDYKKLINKLLRISEDMHWELLTEAAMAIRELQQDAARYRWLRDNNHVGSIREPVAQWDGKGMKGTE